MERGGRREPGVRSLSVNCERERGREARKAKARKAKAKAAAARKAEELKPHAHKRTRKR